MSVFRILLFLFISQSLFAQIQIVAEQDQDRNLTLMALNDGKIPYTIQIEFHKLNNLESPKGRFVFAVAKTGKSTLVKLNSIYVNEPTSFQYNTKLYKGDFQAVQSTDIPFLIPVAEGSLVSMRPLTLQNSQSSSHSSYSGVGFFFDQPASICAPRKGIVSEINMNASGTGSGPVDLNAENFVEIYHSDGTFSRLIGLKSGSVKVEIGDLVIPGQEIAESEKAFNQESHHVKMIQSRWIQGEMKIEWINFPVLISIGEQTILSTEPAKEVLSRHPEAIVSLEMDKKELKKFHGK